MMLFTHVPVGMLAATALTALAPDHAGLVVAAGALGGGAPDLDVLGEHRRTLHFPVVLPTAAAVALTAAVLRPAPGVVALAAAALAAGIHSCMDLLGGGRELRPWERTCDRAVYNHVAGRWHRPRRLVYDGSPGDLALCALVAVPVAAAGVPWARTAAGALLGLAAVYTAFRRRIGDWLPAAYDSFSPYLKTVVAGWARRLGEKRW